MPSSASILAGTNPRSVAVFDEMLAGHRRPKVWAGNLRHDEQPTDRSATSSL